MARPAKQMSWLTGICVENKNRAREMSIDGRTPPRLALPTSCNLL